MATKKTDYQSLTKQLEEIINWFEGDEVNLDQAMIKYEQALELIKQIEDYLKTAENKIKTINTKFGT